MMLLAPALGSRSEELLQDTFKSIVVSFMALASGLAFFWQQRPRTAPLRWHAGLALPLVLMAYALASMAWSHTYLAGVEAIRWFVFALIMGLVLNAATRASLDGLAWSIHGGAVVASLWAALQFLADVSLFPQGPHPASTFINRNFFAEFAVCTLPFAALLIARSRRSATLAVLCASTGLIVTAILMTGTRAALMAMWLQLLVLMPLAVWRYGRHLPCAQWPRGTRAIAALVFIGTIVGLGSIPSGDAKIIDEHRGTTALERGFRRTGSISPNDESLNIRKVMWHATLRMIADRPLAGVGAGAWENVIPLYQDEQAQLETDYYVHNEFLQLLAEYGLVGWAFLLGLAAWLLAAARRTWALGADAEGEAVGRAVILTSLLSLFIVSNVGFAWRMAVTGALFAICLGWLAASDVRIGAAPRWLVRAVPCGPRCTMVALSALVAAAGLAGFITQRAVESEAKLVYGTRLALTIAASGEPNSPRWNGTKAQMFQLLREGIAINPHYRKVTPMAADEIARWGDWQDAIWIWESVLSSRPNVVVILTNVARGYMTLGQLDKAQDYVERARRIRPDAPSLRSMEVLLLVKRGREDEALALGRQALLAGVVDYDMATAVFTLARTHGDFPLAEKAMALRSRQWPFTAPEANLRLGDMYAQDVKDAARAIDAYRQAVLAASPAQRDAILDAVPVPFRDRVRSAVQTSASKG